MEAATAAPSRTKDGWIDKWDPEDDQFWEATGKKIARKNLAWSIFAENLGFSIWVIWAVIVINLGNVGITMSIDEQFLIASTPNLIGSFLRLPYTFAIPRFGGRAWTTFSAALLLLPVALIIFLVPSGWLADQSHGTQLWILLACAATAGVGGGNFSSSMSNISYFYREKEKGLALGLNAAGGNLGVAVCQLLVPLVIIIGITGAEAKELMHPVNLAYAGLLFLPFIVIASVGAWRKMDSLTQAKNDFTSYKKAVSTSQTWIMSLLYVGTFGSFIGYSFALPVVIRNTFPDYLGQHPFIATYLAAFAFMGALIGSLARPLGGWVSDRMGGARVTLACFVGMALFTLLAIKGVSDRSFGLFFTSYMFIFLFSGAGNGSTYRMIPAIFAELGRRENGDPLDFKRRAAAVIGIAGAVGAFGGYIIQLIFRQASLDVAAAVKAATTPADKLAAAQANVDWSIPALWVFVGAYVVFALITWAVYLRRPSKAKAEAKDKAPSLAHAGV